MLGELHISNVAIISDETVTPDRGFTVLTGETGAGKSIIIDSIEFVTGARAQKELIRRGENKASVSALYTNLDGYTTERLSRLGIEVEDGSVLCSRELTSSGSSVCRINGHTVPLSLLREASECLINIHGQHSNQSLLDEDKHLSYLDSYADDGSELAEYSVRYEKTVKLASEITALIRDEREKARLIELYKFQIKDIDSASLKAGEEEALEKKRVLLKSAEKISKHSKLIYRALYRNEKGYSASDMIKASADSVRQLDGILEGSAEYASKLEEMLYELEDIANSVSSACRTDEENPTAALDKTESRLDLISRCKKKYGDSIADILKYRDDIKEKLEELETSDKRAALLKEKLNAEKGELAEKAAVLTQKRKDAAAVLEKTITEQLVFLDMQKVSFHIDVSPLSGFSPSGADSVKFLVSANAGEPLAPLSRIASGGELSRTMLALICAFADKEHTPTLIFDEIDTGISGKTSHKIGIKLCDCAKNAQVICVTHSPQIAALADAHIFVSKSEADGRTLTNASALGYDGRVREIARIIGGEKITDKALSAASELLTQGNKIKNGGTIN